MPHDKSRIIFQDFHAQSVHIIPEHECGREVRVTGINLYHVRIIVPVFIHSIHEVSRAWIYPRIFCIRIHIHERKSCIIHIRKIRRYIHTSIRVSMESPNIKVDGGKVSDSKADEDE